MLMLRRICILLAGLALTLSCMSCQKENASPLVGTSWECVEEPIILVFKDTNNGLFYCKSATNDVYDDIFSSFDFTYKVTEDKLIVIVALSRRIFEMEGTFNNNDMKIGTIWNFKKIQHKVPESTQN